MCTEVKECCAGERQDQPSGFPHAFLYGSTTANKNPSVYKMCSLTSISCFTLLFLANLWYAYEHCIKDWLPAKLENIDIQVEGQYVTYTMPRNYEDKYG